MSQFRNATSIFLRTRLIDGRLCLCYHSDLAASFKRYWMGHNHSTLPAGWADCVGSTMFAALSLRCLERSLLRYIYCCAMHFHKFVRVLGSVNCICLWQFVHRTVLPCFLVFPALGWAPPPAAWLVRVASRSFLICEDVYLIEL